MKQWKWSKGNTIYFNNMYRKMQEENFQNYIKTKYL